MTNTQIIGIDIAKRVFQLHGASADGEVTFRKSVSRAQLLVLLKKFPGCTVAMEACATAHHWGREISDLGHDVRLIPPVYVKPFVKRQKNDANDAEAIAEAASRPTMRFVPVKPVDRQAQATLFRGRGLLVAQRTQLLNALRGHLAEYGLITAEGARRTIELARSVVAERNGKVPEAVVTLAELMLRQIEGVSEAIGELERRLKAEARLNTRTRQLQTMPGVGPMTAIALNAFAPSPETFASGRDFAAWLGLVPRQHSTGGKTRLGKTSKMGQQDIRRLLIVGAMAVVRWAARRPPKPETWLGKMMARKPKMLVAIALANKMARGLWAMMIREEPYQRPAAT